MFQYSAANARSLFGYIMLLDKVSFIICLDFPTPPFQVSNNPIYSSIIDLNIYEFPVRRSRRGMIAI